MSRKPVTIPLSDLPDDFGAFAVEAMGLDPWARSLLGSAWWPTYSRFVLPLHIPAGFALGVAWLAKRHGLSGPPAFRRASNTRWVVDCQWHQNWTFTSDLLLPSAGPEKRWTLVPALADIPDHCATCGPFGWTRGGPEFTPCPECDGGDGNNPLRDAMALECCLRALGVDDD